MAAKRMAHLSAVALTFGVSVGLAVSLAACGAGASPRNTTDGTLSGSVRMATGYVSVRPTHVLTVEVVSEKNKVVARRRAAKSDLFHFPVAPGQYRLGVVGVKGCAGSAEVHSGKATHALIRCTLVDALGSVAFETLPMTGPVRTGTDAMKRLSHGTTGSTRINATEVTWADWNRVSNTGKGGPAAPPTHLSPTITVWVACESGGTYTNFDGFSGWSSTCTAYAAKTGQPLGNTDAHRWPSWFTRLAVRYTGT